MPDDRFWNQAEWYIKSALGWMDWNALGHSKKLQGSLYTGYYRWSAVKQILEVTQGSVLSPILFLILIKDFSSVTSNLICTFADDNIICH